MQADPRPAGALERSAGKEHAGAGTDGLPEFPAAGDREPGPEARGRNALAGAAEDPGRRRDHPGKGGRPGAGLLPEGQLGLQPAGPVAARRRLPAIPLPGIRPLQGGDRPLLRPASRAVRLPEFPGRQGGVQRRRAERDLREAFAPGKTESQAQAAPGGAAGKIRPAAPGAGRAAQPGFLPAGHREGDRPGAGRIQVPAGTAPAEPGAWPPRN